MNGLELLTVEERVVVERALEVEFWCEYQGLQELWRRGEVLTLERWGRRGRTEGAAREMRALRMGLEALLVGFDEITN